MISDDERSRSRLQMSMSLHHISMQVEEILAEKTEAEKVALHDLVFKMVPEGCISYAKKVNEVVDDKDDSDTDRFILSPHGVSVVHALLMSIEENGQFTFEKQSELFAALAKILLEEIPYEIKWAVSKDKDFEITDPLDLISISGHAVDAMHALSEALQRRIGAAVSEMDFEMDVDKKVAEVMSEKARANAGLAHVENRALKAAVFEWCEENLARYKSMDQAAEATAGTLFPKAFTTVRSWMREWKKKNREKLNGESPSS